MRPVERGVSPGVFANYRDAAEPLMQRLGSYCSYCERQIETHLAVEHIHPKALISSLALSWTNFLLACVNCNSCKGDSPIVLTAYLWPDSDNTLKAFLYQQALVFSSHGLTAPLRTKVEALIRLVGLDKDPGNPDLGRRPTSADRRWKYRQDCWDLAQRSLYRLQGNDTIELRAQIVENAISHGGFGIWFTVFVGDDDMRRRLVAAFPGTAQNCFDVNALPMQRIGGQI